MVSIFSLVQPRNNTRALTFAHPGGGAEDLPPHVLQEFIDSVASGRAVVPIDHVYELDQIVEAHSAMEAGTAKGKLVVVP